MASSSSMPWSTFAQGCRQDSNVGPVDSGRLRQNQTCFWAEKEAGCAASPSWPSGLSRVSLACLGYIQGDAGQVGRNFFRSCQSHCLVCHVRKEKEFSFGNPLGLMTQQTFHSVSLWQWRLGFFDSKFIRNEIDSKESIFRCQFLALGGHYQVHRHWWRCYRCCRHSVRDFGNWRLENAYVSFLYCYPGASCELMQKAYFWGSMRDLAWPVKKTCSGTAVTQAATWFVQASTRSCPG